MSLKKFFEKLIKKYDDFFDLDDLSDEEIETIFSKEFNDGELL